MSNEAVLQKSLYTAKASSVGGREGTVKTDDGTLDLAIAMPKGLGGKGAQGTNPEQLFAAGYSACFGSALAFVAQKQKVAVGTVRIDAQVTLGTEESGAFALAVELTAHLPDLPQAEAEALVAQAHQVCPYSRATRGNIRVDLKVTGK
jgi:lipoyl-dependent peroxiredoxin